MSRPCGECAFANRSRSVQHQGSAKRRPKPKDPGDSYRRCVIQQRLEPVGLVSSCARYVDRALIPTQRILVRLVKGLHRSDPVQQDAGDAASGHARRNQAQEKVDGVIGDGVPCCTDDSFWMVLLWIEHGCQSIRYSSMEYRKSASASRHLPGRVFASTVCNVIDTNV